jgi:hypothetical protein
MTTKHVKIAKVKNSRPKKTGEAPKHVKPHNQAKVAKIKGKKPVNAKSNYGVR